MGTNYRLECGSASHANNEDDPLSNDMSSVKIIRHVFSPPSSGGIVNEDNA